MRRLIVTGGVDLSRRRARVRRVLASLGVWALFALIAWLDSDRCALALRPGIDVQTAGVFTAVWTGIQALAGILSSAAAATVSYLAAAVQFLARHVASILRSTGAMFAKSWDALKIVWGDALKPALHWLDTQLTKLHEWLKDTFSPVFRWLQRVRDELNAIYRRFVRPIIDTIEFFRAVNRVLQVFHVRVLQKLDAVLQQIEQRVDEPFEWINVRLTQIQNVVDQIVTLGGLFQRVTLIKSLERYWPDWARIGVAGRQRPVSEEEVADVREKLLGSTVAEVVTATEAGLLGRDGPYDAFVDEFVRQLRMDIEAATKATTLAGQSG